MNRLREDPRIINAGRVGYAFGIDPVLILKSSRLEWDIRVASALVVQEDQEEQERQHSQTAE